MGALLVTGTAAQAHWQSEPSAGFLNGNQASVKVHVSVDVSSNAIAIGGFASSKSNGGSAAKGASMAIHAKHHSAGAMANDVSGGAGFLNGNQFGVSVDAPVTACGNAIAIFGFANASC